MSQNVKNLEELKTSIIENIDDHANDAINIAKQILKSPEPGFREYKTSEIVKNEFEKIGLRYEANIALTGVKAKLTTSKPGPSIAVIGELDSLIVKGHEFADPETLAAHACGHHCQIAMMLAVARCFSSSNILESLSGSIIFIAVPAEEYIEIEFRNELMKAGKLEFLGGKPEFVRLGALDDVDIAMMTHTDAKDSMGGEIGVAPTNNGMLAKLISYVGLAAHAGGSPHTGINALNAATIALSAIHAQRETFKEEDSIRIHPIITRGGLAVSSVPSDVRIETFVRGSNVDAIVDASEKVDRALKAGALAVGADVNIVTLPGYLPIVTDNNLENIYIENAKRLVGSNNVVTMKHRAGSTDMGDLSQIMPVIHPYVGAASGVAHGPHYVIDNYELGVLTGAKAMAMTIAELLVSSGGKAETVINNHKKLMTKTQYLKFLRSNFKDEYFSYK